MKGRLKLLAPYAALLALAAFLYHDTASFAALGRPGQLGPDFWPKAVLVLLMLVCGFEIARVVLAREAPAVETAKARAAPASEEGAPQEEKRFPHLLAGGIVLTVLYVPGIQTLGFFLATAIFLAAFMLVGRYRRPGVIAAASVVGSLAFVFVFMKIVYVSLPLGVGPFRSLSTWIMAAFGIH